MQATIASPASPASPAWIVPVLPLSRAIPKSPILSINRGSFVPQRHAKGHACCNQTWMSRTDSSVSSTSSAQEWNGNRVDAEILVNKIKFNEAGLVPAIAQQWDTKEVLMVAWMSAESVRETMREGRAVYYSRSRKRLWRKGETSGQVQMLRDVMLDCDGDTILLSVDQLGVACHTGRRSCFYTAFRPPTGEARIIADVLMDPKELYKQGE